VPGSTKTVCPGWTTAAAAAIVQNGWASVPLSLAVFEQLAPELLST
jgi:hypothetical protein